ncbi:MAG: hypothetical protein Q8P00_02365 [Dehalococcoidia bacterium]|nr:hypothetical protein [Dehalococcoidia bacterium]
MQEPVEPAQGKSVRAFTLWGLTGCGAGALAGSVIGWPVAMTIAPALEDPTEALQAVFALALLIAGAGAGTAMGMALRKRRVPLIAIVTALGFPFAFLVSFMLSGLAFSWISFSALSSLQRAAVIATVTAITGGIFGAFAGAMLGLLLRGRRGAGCLAAGGAAGGIVAGLVMMTALEMLSRGPQMAAVTLMVGLVVSAAAVGAGLGAALGYLERSKAEGPP